MTISGFTLIHDALEGGYPIVEAIRAVQPFVDEVVAVDMASTDGTRDVLQRLGVRILDGVWENREHFLDMFDLNRECRGDMIVFFEGDEVWDLRLLREATNRIAQGVQNLAVWRLQVSQNFQRCRWYPIPVHRVFPRGQGTYRQTPVGNPANVPVLDPIHGFMWDCANCFRDNWFTRIRNQTSIWGSPRYLMVPKHCTEPEEVTAEEAIERLKEEHWTWQASPFALPEILKPLVGMTKYHARI